LFSMAIIALSALTAVYYYGSLYTYQYRPCSTNNGYPMYPGTSTGASSANMNNDYVDDFWATYYSGKYSRALRYHNIPGTQLCFGHYVINIPWIIQFVLNLLMGTLGIATAVVSVVSATFSCAPVCCYKDEEQDEGKLALLDDAATPDVLAVMPPSYAEKDPIKEIQIDVPTGAVSI